MKAHKSIREAHLWASSLLEEQGIAEGKMVSEWMLRHLLMWERSAFFTRFNDDFDPSLNERFQEMVKRRLSGEPLQYILGEQSFYGLTFKVDRRVLIPRPETEALVENIVTLADAHWSKESVLNIADIGTGSGAIAITLAKLRPNWSVTTVDISTDALEVARENATLNGVEDRVTFIHGNCLDPLLVDNGNSSASFHIIVSNPPYISSKDVLQLESQVKDYEPHLALDGGEDGLDFYRRLVNDGYSLLDQTGFIAFEVGDDQSDDVIQLLHLRGYKKAYSLKDLTGVNRFVIGEK